MPFTYRGKSYLPHLLGILAAVLIGSALAPTPAPRSNELTAQSARDARAYWLKDAGREAEDMRQLAADVQFAELSEKAAKIKNK